MFLTSTKAFFEGVIFLSSLLTLIQDRHCFITGVCIVQKLSLDRGCVYPVARGTWERFYWCPL